MNKLLLLLVLCLPLTAVGQSTPPKGANVIYIALPDSGQVAWRRLGKAFTANGFAIKSSDPKLLTLNTESKPVGEGGQLSASAFVAGNRATFRGVISVPAIDNSVSTLQYRGMKGGTYMRAWEQMDKVVKSLGGTVTYGKE